MIMSPVNRVVADALCKSKPSGLCNGFRLTWYWAVSLCLFVLATGLYPDPRVYLTADLLATSSSQRSSINYNVYEWDAHIDQRMHNRVHAVFSSAEKLTLGLMDRFEKWDEGHRVEEGVWKIERKREGGVYEFKQCGNCLPSQKTGSWVECNRNLKRLEGEKENLLRTLKPPECPPKKPARHCTCFCTLLFWGCYCHLEPDAFVHSERSRKDVIVLALHNVSLWRFAEDTERSDLPLARNANECISMRHFSMTRVMALNVCLPSRENPIGTTFDGLIGR